MNLKDLWIGDKVQVITTGAVGTFEGMAAGNHARIKTKQKEILVPANGLVLFKEAKQKIDLSDLEEVQPSVSSDANLTDELDLHIEKLRPDLEHALPQMILTHQIEATRTYLKKAIKQRRISVVIIHGKGTGQLKEEVYHIIKSHSEIWHTVEKNDGGGVEVWFRY